MASLLNLFLGLGRTIKFLLPSAYVEVPVALHQPPYSFLSLFSYWFGPRPVGGTRATEDENPFGFRPSKVGGSRRGRPSTTQKIPRLTRPVVSDGM